MERRHPTGRDAVTGVEAKRLSAAGLPLASAAFRSIHDDTLLKQEPLSRTETTALAGVVHRLDWISVGASEIPLSPGASRGNPDTSTDREGREDAHPSGRMVGSLLRDRLPTGSHRWEDHAPQAALNGVNPLWSSLTWRVRQHGDLPISSRNPSYFRHARHTGPSTKDDRLSLHEQRSQLMLQKEVGTLSEMPNRRTPHCHSLMPIWVGSLYRSRIPSMLIRT